MGERGGENCEVGLDEDHPMSMWKGIGGIVVHVPMEGSKHPTKSQLAVKSGRDWKQRLDDKQNFT